MTSITDLGNAAWRDYVTDGDPSSGGRRVPKSEVRAVMVAIDIQKAQVVDTLAEFRALTSAPEAVLIKGKDAAVDGWGGVFVRVAGSVAPDDEALVLRRTAGGDSYKRLFNPVVMDDNGDALVAGAFAAAVVNATSVFQFGGSTVLSRGGGFTIIYENAGAPGLLLAASSNYYQSAEHVFRDDDQATVLARLNGTGLRLGAGAPAKQLHLYGSDNSLQILQKLQNYNAGTPIAAIGFDVTAFGETEVCKAAIGFTRNNAQGVGDYVFLLRNNTDTTEVTAANEVLRIQAAGHVLPGADNAQNLGSGSLRYGTVYAGTGAINTSGRAAKMFIGDAIDAERRAARRILDIGPRRYKLAEAVEKKGDAARWHFGYVAEDVRDALAAEGLDPWTYGFMCRDRVLANERYTETESRPKTRKVEDYENVVEVRDGKPVRIRKAVERDDPVGTMQPVYDEGGAPVMVEVRNAQGALALAPMLHFVPEMEEVEVELVRQVDTGVDRLGLRYSELEAFLRCAA